MKIRLYRDSDWPALMRMSAALLKTEEPEGLAAGMHAFLQRDDAALFIAEDEDRGIAGYVQVGERPYADGCPTSPIGYIEEWFVDPDVRRMGVGSGLLRAAEEWAHARGIAEMASDSLLDNTISQRAHVKAGYREVERAVRYRKVLDR